MEPTLQINPMLDLAFERIVDVPKELVWQAWTTPDLIKQWFTLAPWKTIECEIDLRPGGIFRTVMLSPEGQEFPNQGCYLEVFKNERLVWTNALTAGFRPAFSSGDKADSAVGFAFTAAIALAAQGSGTKYTATLIHADEAACRQHAEMGFHEGWGKALDQLVALVSKM